MTDERFINEMRRAEKFGQFLDSIGANAASQHRGSRASHGAADASPPFGFDPLSQETPREPAQPDKRAGRNS